jgi:hypothetical protein
LIPTPGAGLAPKTKAPTLPVRSGAWKPFSCEQGQIAGLMMLLGRIAPLLSLCRRSIRVHRPLLNCPLLVLDRSFLSVRPRVIAWCHLWLVAYIVAGRHLSLVTWVVTGWHLSPVMWLIVSSVEISRLRAPRCLRAPRLRISRFLVSYFCVGVRRIVPGIVVPGIVP